MAGRTDRRTRNGSGALSLLVAAVMLIGAVLAIWAVYARTPSQPTAATAAAPSSAPDAGASSASTTVTTTPAPTTAPDAPVPDRLPAGVLLTTADLAEAGITTTGAVPRDEPALPALCGLPWQQVWSGPAQSVGQGYPASGAGVTEHVAAYADAPTAGQAFTRLVGRASTCSSAQNGAVTVSSPDAGLGEDSAVLRYDDGGVGGALSVTWAVLVRGGDRMLLVTYTTSESIGTGSGPGDGGDDAGGDSPQAQATARAIAAQALPRLARTAGN